MTTATNAVESVRIEQANKRLRAYLGGEVVADTTRPLLVWEKPNYPTYYVPLADIRADLLDEDDSVVRSPHLGDAKAFTVRAGGQERVQAALLYAHSPFEELRDAIRVDWSAMDAWFEEDEEVFTHARDPYSRIDILRSSRVVRVEVDGVTIAESTQPTLLFETRLPTRYYLPKTDVRMDLLAPSPTSTTCPYKGEAEYWSLSLGEKTVEDVAWSYRTPLPESQKIAGLVCFYPEKVDLYVDGLRAAAARV
ncbi:MAG TPA: DUF427 domain-containing protein [Gaiellaceae bacterium]|nr:DUF427 domain-containing protein [Gaiellaceae bacterium]